MSGDTPVMDDQSSNPSKVFVGGLGQQTTDLSLRTYFAQFGEVQDAAVVIDKANGRSRGFGFCTFSNPEAAAHCLNQRHKIDGVSCEVRRAVPREQAQDNAPYDTVSQPGKAFVGGLTDEITEERLSQYFSQFGPIKESTLMYDKTNHRPRGFGFVTFENTDDVNKALGSHPELGPGCEVKLAEPRPPPTRHRGGGGRGRYEDYGPPRNSNWSGRGGGRSSRTSWQGPYDSSYGQPIHLGQASRSYGGGASYYGGYAEQNYGSQASDYGSYNGSGYGNNQYAPHRKRQEHHHGGSGYTNGPVGGYEHSSSYSSSSYGGSNDYRPVSKATANASASSTAAHASDPYGTTDPYGASSPPLPAYQQPRPQQQSQYNYDPYASASTQSIGNTLPGYHNPYGASSGHTNSLAGTSILQPQPGSLQTGGRPY